MMKVRVPSLSKNGVSWLVERVGEVVGCECPRFAFSKRPQRCSHTDIVRKADRVLERCAELHGVTAECRLCRQCLVEMLALVAGKVKREFVTKTESKEKIAAARKKRSRKKKEPSE